MSGSGWSNQVQNQVIVSGANGGVFVYSPSPGAGNLIASVAPAAGTDPYGNPFPEGFALYRSLQSGGAAFELSTSAANQASPGQLFSYVANKSAVNELYWLNIEGPENVNQEDLVAVFLGSSASDKSSSAQGFLSYVDPSGGNHTNVFWDYAGTSLFVAGPITAVKPGTGTSPANAAAQESWHAMTPLLNSWAGLASNVANQYRLVASPPNCVEIIGTLNATAATAVTFFTLPTGYIPASQQGFPVGTFSGSAAADNVTFLQCDTSGNLTIQQRTATQTDIRYHGLISLDA